MRLNRLIKQVAPLPWHIERSNIKALRLRTEVFSDSKDSHTSMPILVGESAPVLLAVHAVRVLPRVLDALRAISQETECTCTTHHSWFGNGHCSACPCKWFGKARTKVEAIRKAKAWNASLKEIALFRLCEVKKKH